MVVAVARSGHRNLGVMGQRIAEHRVPESPAAVDFHPENGGAQVRGASERLDYGLTMSRTGRLITPSQPIAPISALSSSSCATNMATRPPSKK